MRVKHKKAMVLIFLAGCALAGYWGWLSLRPVNIVAVYQRASNFSSVLVKSFPFTDHGKINWWMENKTMLKAKYNIPVPAKDGYFSVTFWLFGDGYKEEGKYDRLCFDELKTHKNCIEKEALLTVSHSKNRGTVFTIYDGDDYRLEQSGDLVKIEPG